jgi:hypothetical protein
MVIRPSLQGLIATACKDAYGAIPAIANSPATPNAWQARAVLTPIAGSIPSTRSLNNGAVPIATDTERITNRHRTCSISIPTYRGGVYHTPHHINRAADQTSIFLTDEAVKAFPLLLVWPSANSSAEISRNDIA